MFTKNDIIGWIYDALERESLKSYSHKPHLQTLPHDRRSTDVDELIDRFDACTSKMSELKTKLDGLESKLSTEMNSLVKNKADLKSSLDELGQMALDNQAFYDADDKVLEKKKEWVNSIQERANIDYSLPNNITDEVLGLHDYFNGTSWVEDADAKKLNNLADRIVDFANEQSGGDDARWSKGVMGIADDIRAIASNDYFNKDLPKLHDSSHDLIELTSALENVDNLQKNVDTGVDNVESLGVDMEDLQGEYTDFYTESLNTVRRAGELGLLD